MLYILYETMMVYKNATLRYIDQSAVPNAPRVFCMCIKFPSELGLHFRVIMLLEIFFVSTLAILVAYFIRAKDKGDFIPLGIPNLVCIWKFIDSEK